MHASLLPQDPALTSAQAATLWLAWHSKKSLITNKVTA